MMRDCLEHARTAIDLDPKSIRAWNNLAIALRVTDDQTGSLAAYEKALKLAPDDAKVLAEYAVTTAKSRPSGAESAARHAIQLLQEGNGLDAETSVYPPYPAVVDAFILLGKPNDAYTAAIEGVKKMPSFEQTGRRLRTTCTAKLSSWCSTTSSK